MEHLLVLDKAEPLAGYASAYDVLLRTNYFDLRYSAFKLQTPVGGPIVERPTVQEFPLHPDSILGLHDFCWHRTDSDHP